MNILLTGATGFLGSHLLREFVARGHTVVALRRVSSTRRLHALDQVTWVLVEDLWKPGSDKFRGVDVVVHTAVNYGRNNEPLTGLLNDNLFFPLRLLEEAVAQGVKSFINAGTSLPRELNGYALSKAQFADWGRYFADNSNLTFLNLQLEHMYGPGDDPAKFTDRVIDACLKNQDELALTRGEQLRDFVFVNDAAEAFCHLLPMVGGRVSGYRDLSVGSGQAITIREFVETVHRLTQSRTELRFGAVPYRDCEVMTSVADTREMAALGWLTRVGLLEGLSTTIKSKYI